jgi:predicted  nucleic acid-binding Zn-ribbon protein
MLHHKLSLFSLLLSLLLLSACHRSPEELPKYKKKFRTQIASFESQKERANKKVENGVNELSGLREAIQNAKNVDQEFNQVYGKWEQVNRQVEALNKDYERLKEDAENLFTAMQSQTAGLRDEATKKQLDDAIADSRADYEATLSKTAQAIERLRSLHTDAVDIIKALEVAVALGQIAEINEGLQNIESKVDGIMADLNSTISESKALYENRIDAF